MILAYVNLVFCVAMTPRDVLASCSLAVELAPQCSLQMQRENVKNKPR